MNSSSSSSSSMDPTSSTSSSSSSSANGNNSVSTVSNNSSSSNQDRNVRQRSIITPVDKALLTSRLWSCVNHPVSLSDLMDEETLKTMNMNRNYIDGQLIRLITPGSDKMIMYGVRRRNNQQEVHFQRLLLCRLQSTSNTQDNSQLFYLMMAHGTNRDLFDRNIEFRDDGTITIGTMFRIIQPLKVDNLMNGDIPLITTKLPFIVLDMPYVLPQVIVNREILGNSSMSFIYNNIQLSINRTTPMVTSCSGHMCDKQRIEDWYNTSSGRKCGCYHMAGKCSNIVFQHSIHFPDRNGDIIHENFSSVRFDLMYLSSFLPGTVRISSLRGDSFFDIEAAIQNVIHFVNNNGGWTAIGWYKRGLINDKSLLEVSNDNIEVGSGNISFHIVRLLPSNRQIIEGNNTLSQALNEMKYDVSLLSNA